MKEMRNMMMRTKMEFMKDFLIICLGCPRPEISKFTSESVIKHAELLVSQILSYQQAEKFESAMVTTLVRDGVLR